ncbi:leucine-rich repeat receptor-like protein kinase at2g19210-like protein, partial [Trifolium pratense]
DYSSLETKINYISDAKFIDTGESKRVNGNIPVKQQLQYVRSFPIGVKNCYRIDVTNGTKYLIRASFYYGNYDNLNQPPQFDLTFGANVWDTVKIINLTRITTSEIIYTPSLDYIQPCLVNTGQGTPFISAIELRPLNKETYVSYSTKAILSLIIRLDMGSITNLEYRYKDDVYDRAWLPFNWNETKRLSTNDDLLTQSIYKAPTIVMSTAVTPVNDSAPVQITFDAENVTDQYYAYLHFNEVEKLAENETREFNITVNGQSLYEFEIPVYRNWQGDPCGPVKYMWEGLNCSVDDGNNPPRITSLNLSSSGLTGKIESSISKLTMLQYLDLSNNSLIGPLPDFLIQLHSLKVLKVEKNKLTGLVPSGLLERSKSGSLSLSVDDNSGLCTTKPCKKKSLLVPLIASIAALVVVILLISLTLWIFKRQKVTSANSKKRGSLESKHQAFSYTEVLNITDNFKTIIGEGGFGKVYLGVLQNHTQVAVKMLSLSSMQGYKEFKTEVKSKH